MRRLTLIALGIFSISLPILAADPVAAPKPQLYLIHEEVARPSMLPQYESMTTEILNTLTEKKADPKVFGMNLYVTNDLHYVYIVPISGWAALDTFQQSWMKIGEAVGKEKWAMVMKRANETMESYTELVAAYRPDLSYVPANPRFKPEEAKFVHWEFYYLDAVRAEESEQVARDYVAFFKSKNIGDGFQVYQAQSGSDLPLLVVAVPAKSAADYWETDEKITAAYGKELQPLQMRAMSITRRFETRDANYRADLSFPLPAK